jgi:sporulation integral membrane protein YtvI
MDKETRLEKQKEFLIQFSYWAVWIISGALLIKFAGPVLLPFVIAFVVAWMLMYPVDYLAGKLHIRRNVVAVAVIIIFYGALALGVYALGNRIVGLIQNFFGEMTEFFEESFFPMLDMVQSDRMMEQVGKVLSELSGTLISGVSDFAAKIPGICMKALIAVIATIFMEIEIHPVLGFLKRQLPARWQEMLQRGKKTTVATIWKCVLAYVVIFGMTYLELALGFALLKVEGAFVIALIIAVLDILPVLGTGTVLIPWSIIAFSTGNLRMGSGVLLLYLFITIVRNIVEPKLVGRQMGLSPVVMLPCMLLGLQFFGIAGLIGLPLIVAFLKNLNDRDIIQVFRK